MPYWFLLIRYTLSAKLYRPITKGYLKFQVALVSLTAASCVCLSVIAQLGVDVGLRQVVGVVAQGGQRHAHHHFHRLLFVVARV